MNFILDNLPESRRGRIVLASAAVVVVAVAIAIGSVRSRKDNASNDTNAPPAMTVTAVPLATVELARSVTANGTIFPWQEIIIGPEVGGYRVAAVNVDVGDRVRSGQELVRLSGSILDTELASKRANVEQAQATLENAAAAYRRAQSLSGTGALSKSDMDKLKSEELGARARVAVGQADLDQTQLRVKHTHVTAPDDGIITSRSVSVGQVAQVGTEMLRLLRKGRVEWRAEIPEARLREIAVGQKVVLATADGSTIDGKVRTVAPTIDQQTRAGLVYVDIPAGTARPGMFARGELVLERAAAQMAPLSSVVILDGYSYVFVVKNDSSVERRRVETGAVKDRQIEIVSGVQSGERIVEKGAGFLKDGDHVSVVSTQVATN